MMPIYRSLRQGIHQRWNVALGNLGAAGGDKRNIWLSARSAPIAIKQISNRYATTSLTRERKGRRKTPERGSGAGRVQY